jgi:DNA-directed RNA polymerase specialized sigma24 family protein
MSSRPAQPTLAGSSFPATRWTLILDLRSGDGPAADRALSELCRLYWYPVYAFVRRQGSPPEDAQDLTQGFFAMLVQRGDLERVRQEKGRLRTFLLAALKNHLVQDWRHRTAQKRGGGVLPLPLDTALTEARYCQEPLHPATPDALFDRRWALDAMEEALRQVEEDYTAAGRAALHEALQPYISTRINAAQAAEIGRAFAMTEGAVHVSIHRLRQRFRRTLERLVASTTGSGEDAADELRHLLEIISH